MTAESYVNNTCHGHSIELQGLRKCHRVVWWQLVMKASLTAPVFTSQGIRHTASVSAPASSHISHSAVFFHHLLLWSSNESLCSLLLILDRPPTILPSVTVFNNCYHASTQQATFCHNYIEAIQFISSLTISNRTMYVYNFIRISESPHWLYLIRLCALSVIFIDYFLSSRKFFLTHVQSANSKLDVWYLYPSLSYLLFPQFSLHVSDAALLHLALPSD
jgi:hypothetical protein